MALNMQEIEVCEHVTALRYLTTANGARQYRYQCLKCGHTVGKVSIKYTELSPEQKAVATPYDTELQDEKDKQRYSIYRAAREAEYTERSIQWMNEHDEYMRSEEWRFKRRLVLQRDNYTCKANLDGCTHTAQQVHHLTYDHWKNEPLFDLISICNHCHDQITAMDRARRQQVKA